MTPTRRAPCERDAESSLLRVAARQHGVVTRSQVLGSGMTKSMLETRIRRGRLERIHPAVYRVAGSPRTFEQRAFAAAAWAGPGAAVSHCTAAHLWRMIAEAPRRNEVWTPRKRTRAPRDLCVHFTEALSRRDRGTLRNIPITSPVRTLIDLAGTVPEQVVEAALAQAIVDRRVTGSVLLERLRDMSRQGFPGPPVLRRLLVPGGRRCHARSPLERRVGEVLAGPGLPPVRREHPVYVDGGVYYLDFAWPHFRVGVEADSRRWHSDAGSFERDRVRHNELASAGWRVLRVTEQQVRSDPTGIRAQVLRLLVRG